MARARDQPAACPRRSNVQEQTIKKTVFAHFLLDFIQLSLHCSLPSVYTLSLPPSSSNNTTTLHDQLPFSVPSLSIHTTAVSASRPQNGASQSFPFSPSPPLPGLDHPCSSDSTRLLPRASTLGPPLWLHREKSLGIDHEKDGETE